MIPVARNEGKYVCLPDQIMSRCHANLRETRAGEQFVQDACCNNGMIGNGTAVPRQGKGPAVRVTSLDSIRFCDEHGQDFAVAALLK